MKRIAMIAGLGLFLALPSLLATQNHGEAGVFADYFRFGPSSTTDNFVGVGGRVSFNAKSNLALKPNELRLRA